MALASSPVGSRPIGAGRLATPPPVNSGAWPIGGLVGLGMLGGFSVIVSGTTYNETLSESVAMADTVAALMTMPNTISEYVTVADSASAAMVFVASLTESVAVADSVAASMAMASSISEAITVAESLGATQVMVSTISASVTLTATFDGFIVGIVWPAPGDVKAGVLYGPNGNDYVGTLKTGGGMVMRRR